MPWPTRMRAWTSTIWCGTRLSRVGPAGKVHADRRPRPSDHPTGVQLCVPRPPWHDDRPCAQRGAEEPERDFSEMVQGMHDPQHIGIVRPRWRRWFGLIAQATQLVMGEAASRLAVTEIVEDKSSEAAEVQAWCVSKLHPVIGTRHMCAIVGTGHDAVNTPEFMGTGRSSMIDLAGPFTGPTVDRASWSGSSEPPGDGHATAPAGHY